MHKKLWPLLVCLLSIWFTVNLSAASLEDLSYRIVGEEIQITKCNTAASETLDIPATIEGKPVTSIEGEAFAFCRLLESIKIPDGVTTIGTDAFYDCDRLKTINVHPDNSHFSSLSGVLYNKNKTILRVVPEGYTGLLEVPESVNLIALYALQGCRNITEIIFKPLQAPAIEEEDGDPFWALEGKTALVLSNAQGYDTVGYKSLDIKSFDKKNEILIYPGSNMPGADFSNMDLREVDFTGVSFPRANFSGSNLEGAKFSNAFLEDSNFSNAKLNNAILLGANLVGTNLDQSDLVGANLIGIVTGGHIGTPINIPTEFRMLNGNLIGPGVQIYVPADLSGLDLSGMDLSGSQFERPDFSGANLSRVNFTGAFVYRADFSGANLTEIILKDAVCYTPYFENTTFTGADFSGAKVYAHRNEGGGATNFSEADLSGVDFTGALLFSGNFSGANLSGAHLSKAKLGRTPNIDNASIKMAGGANFQGANLSNTDLSGADLENIISADIEGFPAALPDGFRLISGYIIGPKVRLPSSADLSGGNLAGLNLEGASMPNVNFSGANLAGTKLAGANIGWASPTELLPIVGEPESLPMHWQLRDGYLFDSRAPKVTLIGSREVIHKVGLEYLDPGATAIDNEGNSLEVETRGIVDSMGLKLGVYGIRYTASDAVGNVGSAYRIVRVVDLTPPVITLNGKALLHVMLGTAYQDAGASAIDNVDGAVAVTTSGNVDPNTLGTYTLTYKASDQAGNVVSDHREIKVINPAIANGLNNLQFRDNGSRAIVTGCTRTARGAIEIPSTYNGKPVTSIKEKAFHLCKSLTSITIPNSVEFIGEGTFEGCESLSSVIIGNSVTSIAEKAFMNCSELKSVTIPDSVTSIGNNAFQYCYELKSAAIGSSVTSIGDYSFANCSGLTSVNIGKSINSIGRFAFNKCTSLIDFTIPDSITFIGNSAFENCRSLTSITIPDKVASIEKKTFSYCINLESVTISDNVTSIGAYAFHYCRSLTDITIPDGVTIIEIDAFSRCESLKSAGIGSIVTSIGNGAFSNCKSLTSVTIGKSVKVIGESAFKRCKKLENVTIPDSVYSIRSYAFQYCGSLRSVTFEGNAPETLGKGVFSRTRRDAKAYVKANAKGFGSYEYGGLPLVREGLTTTASKGNTSDGPIMGAVVFFDVNLNGLPDKGEPQTTSNGWGDYWLDIPLETYDLNDNGVIDISEGVIVSQGGTDTATGLPVKTTLKGPANATVITPLTTLVTRVMEQNPELDASAAADKLEASLGIPDGVDILNFDTFKEASEENPSAADVLTATAKLQDTLVQGGNLIGGATGKSLQEGSDAMMDAIAQQVKAGNNVDLDSKGSLKSLITEAASTSGANLTEAQTDGAASIMEASSKAKEDAKAAAGTVTELATEVSRVQAVSQSKAADDLEAVGAQTADLESTVLAYTGAAMQQQVQTEVAGDFNASSYEAPVFAFQSASYTVNENGQQQPVIQINRTGNSFEAVELTVTPLASSATAGEDFNGEPVAVSFEPLEIRKTLDLQALVIDDVLVEEAETFSLQLEVVRDPEDPDLPELPEGEEDLLTDRPTVGTLGLATLTIISDDIANEAPTVSSIEDLEISEGAAQVSVDFSVTDTDSSFEELTVQASTSNPFLISGLVVEGTAGEQDASQWVLNFATVADRFGEGTITVEINDGYQIVSTSFNVTVSAVNNAPQISGVPSVIEAEGRKVVVPFEVSDDQTSAGNLFIYLTAQPLDYILKGHVLVVGNGAQRELILNNSGNAEGTGQFSVVVTDADGKTATQAFEVNFGGEPPVAVVPELKLNTSDPSNLTLSWEGDAQLLFTEDLSAGFEVVAGATSPYTIEQVSMGFYILRVEP